jgi:hypothetical protein
MQDRIKPRVVCAACRSKDGILVTGARHFDMVMHNIIELIPNGREMFTGAEQGFIDQRGNFLTREEAYDIAKNRGQIWDKQDLIPGTLFSENLY